MSIEVKIICDSISPHRVRLTTFQLKYPRFIHAQIMTHRTFSRNAQSSRAIPVSRNIEDVMNTPAIPVHWGINQPGMQAREEVDAFTKEIGISQWLDARDKVVEIAKSLNGMKFHKQIVNRLLEPWSHISVILTGTEFNNFFNLRCHDDAQPEIAELACKMRDLYEFNRPKQLDIGEWHLPYITNDEKFIPGFNKNPKNIELLIKASVARCARVSYLNHDKSNPNLDKDIALHNNLLKDKHLSPFEHQATPIGDPEKFMGNFRGWCQYRKLIRNESGS